MSQVVYTPIIDNNKSVFYYSANVLSNALLDEVTEWLTQQTYIDGHCGLSGKQSGLSGKQIPRQQLWFQKDNNYFCREWKVRYPRWKPQKDYPKLLDRISTILLEHIRPILDKHNLEIPTINSCLINKYRDGNDSIRAHRDTYLSFGETPVIIGVSIGDSRILRVRKLHNPDVFKSLKVERESDENIDFVLENNSVFVMAGYSQIYFSHEVPKMENKGQRYSLTFREYLV
jgi:alkylated DNA repair dioxygenase AlkB